jgi:hypothetical protein
MASNVVPRFRERLVADDLERYRGTRAAFDHGVPWEAELRARRKMARIGGS